ncbi:MAG: hypothetical protein J7K31_04265 [Candidatus Aenigmarchaeota archaeon]|nr:hypothetical protein [Candidatus Aenigmarchaeota archaeon]
MVRNKSNKNRKVKKSVRKRDVPLWYLPVTIIALGILIFVLALMFLK